MVQIVEDLNRLLIEDEGNGDPLKDYRAVSVDGLTTVLFKNLEYELIQRIKQADIVVGAVAWLTNENILEALSEKWGVALVVQKEDFLRPDLFAKRGFADRLRCMYKALPGNLSRYNKGLHGTTLCMMSYCGDPTIEAVRCIGNHNCDKLPAFPRMHHKFVVFCRLESNGDDDLSLAYQPYEVWTGSFNFTENAVRSFENAVVTTEKNIVQAFFKEFGQIEALSECLDWGSQWVCPEWRIGS
jgi:PLD-like domain